MRERQVAMPQKSFMKGTPLLRGEPFILFLFNAFLSEFSGFLSGQ